MILFNGKIPAMVFLNRKIGRGMNRNHEKVFNPMIA